MSLAVAATANQNFTLNTGAQIAHARATLLETLSQGFLMANALFGTPTFSQGDRVKTTNGELGQIEVIHANSILVRLDSGEITVLRTFDVKLIAPTAFNSPRIDWRLIDT